MACEKMSSTVYKNSHKQRFRDYKRSIWHDNFFFFTSSFSSTSIIIYYLLPRAVAIESIWVGIFVFLRFLSCIRWARNRCEWHVNERIDGNSLFFRQCYLLVILSFERSKRHEHETDALFSIPVWRSRVRSHLSQMYAERKNRFTSLLLLLLLLRVPHLRFVCRCFCWRDVVTTIQTNDIRRSFFILLLFFLFLLLFLLILPATATAALVLAMWLCVSVQENLEHSRRRHCFGLCVRARTDKNNLTLKLTSDSLVSSSCPK